MSNPLGEVTRSESIKEDPMNPANVYWHERKAVKLNPWTEYDLIAEDLAKRGLKGTIGDPLPNLISSEVHKLINDDPEAFERRVRQCAYALAMTRHVDEYGNVTYSDGKPIEE